MFEQIANGIDDRLFALTRFKGLLYDDIISFEKLSAKMKTAIASISEDDEKLLSVKLIKQVFAKIDFLSSSVLELLDAKKKVEEDKLLKAKAERDKRINDLAKPIEELNDLLEIVSK